MFARHIFVLVVFCSLPARGLAFVPVKGGLTEVPPATPRVASNSLDLASVAKSGRAMVRGNETFSFLGRHPLRASAPAACLSTTAKASQDLRLWAVAEARSYLGGLSGGLLDPDSLRLADAHFVDGSIVVQFHPYVAAMRIEGVSALVAVGPSGVFYARHNLVVTPETPSSHPVTEASAQRAALEHVLTSVGDASPRGDPEKVVLLDEAEGARVAWRVEVDTLTPNGWWAIYVHAGDGTVVASQRLSFHAVAGSVHFQVEPNCQGDATEQVQMPYVQWRSDAYTDADGNFSTTSTPSVAEVVLDGPYFTLYDRDYSIGGPWAFSLQPLPTHNALEVTDAYLTQTDAFYHAHVVRGWMLRNGSSNSSQVQFAASDFDINVNVRGSCNAYYDGTSINFYGDGDGCNDTARISNIVFHEYGHAIHDHSSNDIDGQMSEGISDFVAATIRNDPEIGGIFSCDQPFRSCENDLSYCSRGCDFNSRSDVHEAGQVMCAVLWEFRQMMVDRYGYDEGVAHTDRIFLKFLTLVGDMDSAYDAAIAADDDDDDNPANGTTHSCELNRAFADDSSGGTNHFPMLRGAVPSLVSAELTHDPPGRVDSSADSLLALDFRFALDSKCLSSDSSAQVTTALVFELPGQAEREVELQTPETSDLYRALIADLEPPVALSYYARFEVDGRTSYYPAQPDDSNLNSSPVYRQGVYFGEQKTIFFDDLEGTVSAFTTSTRNGDGVDDGLSDWQHGTPSASAGGPRAAHSGQKVWGTNLDGATSEDRESTLELGPLSTQGFSQVRLQLWRQLFSADEVRIEVNGETVYQQRATDFDWQDPEWIFLDIDISAHADDTEDLRIRFILDDATDNSTELAGLYIDDLRLVGTAAPEAEPSDEPNDDSQADDGSLADSDAHADNSTQTAAGSDTTNGLRDVAPLIGAMGCSCNGGAPTSVWILGLAVLLRMRRRRR